MKTSAFVIAYNRVDILETCLKSARFVDELIVVDKSSTDNTPEVAKKYADKYIKVPWSPTVESTRCEALANCTNDFIMFLDDDECLSPEAVRFIIKESENPRADIYGFPFRNYVLGRHDKRACYWPQYQLRLFKRGALEFTSKVHGGITLKSDNRYDLPLEGEVYFHHLSHFNAACWIEKTNRYTSQVDRSSSFKEAELSDLSAFTNSRMEFWMKQVKDEDNYLKAVAILRAFYDVVDGLKKWEETQVSGKEEFSRICKELQIEYAKINKEKPSWSKALLSAFK